MNGFIKPFSFIRQTMVHRSVVHFPLGTGTRAVLCLISVACFRLSFPEGPVPVLAWVCLVPASLAIHGLTTGQAFLWGLLSASTAWLLSVWWITVGLTGWVGLPQAAAWAYTALFCLYAALPYALSMAAWSWCREPYRPEEALFSAAFLTVFVSWIPQIFPGNPAHALYGNPVPIQVLDLGGVPLLLFMLTLVNRLLAGILVAGMTARSLRSPLLLLLLCSGVMCGYGLVRLNQYHEDLRFEPGDLHVTVAATQPNIPVKGLNHVLTEDRGNDLATLFRLTEEAAVEHPTPDLIVWPEIPLPVSCSDVSTGGRSASQLSQDLGIPILTPCIQVHEVHDGTPRFHNVTRLIRSDGRPAAPYVKRILVPFSEYLPLEEEIPFLRRIFPGAAHYVPGKEMVLFELKDGALRLIPAICYEAVFSGHIREGAEAGGNVIVNMVDDAWFGRTDGSAIHMALGVFRAVEFRMPLIRVTNSGNGVFVRASGEIVPESRTPLFEKAIRAASLGVPNSRPLFARWGNGVLWALTLLSGVGALRLTRKSGAG